MNNDELRQAVRERYGRIAQREESCCGPVQGCCESVLDMKGLSPGIGYTEEELAAIPAGADMGLGCGNPTALASLAPGETVLDLGSGAGIDCFLAAAAVGAEGHVIGVDMTPEMVARSREHARREGYANVEFRLGEIEHLPVESDSVDAVVSNCVINLSPDKDRVFGEAFRVIRPGGRLMVSDIVLERPLPESLASSVEAYVGCVAGGMLREDYLRAIEAAGFGPPTVLSESGMAVDCLASDPTVRAAVAASGFSREDLELAAESVTSVCVQARKTDPA